jgi:hypothetical protein
VRDTTKHQTPYSNGSDEPAKVTIESEAESLFAESPGAGEEAEWEKEPDAFAKYELLGLSFAHLREPSQNETCLGYINKLYSSVLRREGNLFLEFLRDCPEYRGLLVSNICHYSIANMLSVVLSSEDKTGEYKFEQLKQGVFSDILEFGLRNVADCERFEGFLTVFEEILSSAKQSYYEYFEDFKRCANIFVSQSTLAKFYSFLDADETSFGNSAAYLELVVKRVNSEFEEQETHATEKPEPSIKFEHTFLYISLDHLISLLLKSQTYVTMG